MMNKMWEHSNDIWEYERANCKDCKYGECRVHGTVPCIEPVKHLEPMHEAEGDAWLASFPGLDDKSKRNFISLHPKLRRFVTIGTLADAKDINKVFNSRCTKARQ